MKTQRTSVAGVTRRNTAVAALLLAGLAGGAHAQWTVVNMHPSWAPSSEIRGISDGQQVGFTGVFSSAVMWTGTPDSAVVLDPEGSLGASALCVQNGVQGGWVKVPEPIGQSQAALWNGTAKSFVSLHPEGATNSQITAMDGDIQGGVWFSPDDEGLFALGHPCIWRGTPESFVDLTPFGHNFAEVHGVGGNIQVGGTFDNFLAEACMWEGTPESFVRLQPDNALFSIASCTDGVYQFGTVLFGNFEDPKSVASEVGFWAGSADSWSSLTPPGMHGGVINDVDGKRQVGVMGSDAVGNGPYFAATWLGTTDTFENLHAALPAEYSESWAYAVWHDDKGTAYIGGAAMNDETGRIEAIMWISGGTSCPADFDGSGEVNSQDFFDFLNAFFDAAPEADFNADGSINSQDFFDFLNAFFAGC